MKQYDFESFLNVRRSNGEELLALCPFHSDRNPSFSANIHTGLWICHAGCGAGHYATFLSSLKKGSFTGEIGGRSLEKKSQETSEDLSLFHRTDEYIYIDLNHHPRLRVTRLETSLGEKRFRQEHLDQKGNWVNKGVGALPLLPYRYEDWCTPTEPLLFVVEGEKCVRFLIGLGFQATTFVGGANAWKNHYAQYFQNRDVVVLPDNDAPGKRFGDEVLLGIQAVTRARIINLPGLGPGEDVFDWFKKGGTMNLFRDLIA